ncbi:MAG: adenylyl-sulfate kinase [Clostridiales bacterium]|nr:adenylyl-sulfate kinase [Clostridiales bacterium]
MKNDTKEAGGLLKFVTCGSVDDGKSTLIGHMLYDAKLLYADQVQALELDSKVGSRGGKIDYSLLLDGLMAEREQGITIDVAYRYFSTEHRSFIVADAPGHEEYTRNMAVGASFADLAVILVDATQGILTQTRRHTRICALMGIRHFVFAVNKMDLVQYNRYRFYELERELRRLVAEFLPASVAVIPVSATEGDNVTRPSTNMYWYEGPALLTYLEQVPVADDSIKNGFVLPVQRVCRPDRTFRGFQGQVACGQLRVGDAVIVLPSGEKAHVSHLLMAGQPAEEITAGEAVTVQLDREVDVSRGDVIMKNANLNLGRLFTATILWMDDTSLSAGRNYTLKLGTKQIPATVLKIRHKIDINTGSRIPADRLKKNELAVCDIAASDRVIFNRFQSRHGGRCDKALGCFLLIDRVTNMTSACGTVLGPLVRDKNLVYQETDITKELRASQKNQKPLTVWFTGLSGSGKSALANELEKRLVAMGKHTMLLDGDNIRMGLNKNLSFEEADRVENIRRIAEVAKLMNDAGLIVMTSFISPFERDRNNAREVIGSDFFEVYVSTPLEECERRDVKGLYQKARNGEIPDFTGISSPFEVPQNPDLTVNTADRSIESCVDEILHCIEGRI